jgi:hypothetical protein
MASTICLILLVFTSAVYPQIPLTPDAFPIVRTKTMTKTAGFGPGGTIVLLGAPKGSVIVEGWNERKVRIEAEIIVRANNEEDAARLAKVTGFYVDEDVTSVRIYSVGPHDKRAVKKIDKKFPKKLRKNPFSISYKIKVPHFSDLQIDGGDGALDLRGVEGVHRINYQKSNAVLHLIGGSVQVTVGTGSVDVTIATRSWRGRDADIQLATGNLNLRLPKNLNADLEARILRTGSITNSYSNLSPKPRTEFSGTFMNAIGGSGGARLAFTVGDGSMNIRDFEKPAQ